MKIKKIKIFFLLILSFYFSPDISFSVINQTINYQGFLIDKNTNLPVDGAKDIKFVIYDFSTGGSELFSENRCKVPVNKGRYDVEIGSITPGGIPASVFLNHTNVWLEIQIDPDNNCSGEYDKLYPRIKMQTSPYSFNSLYASTASAATTHFMADTIDAYPSTSYGAITISTNLFVMGGISVGSISPGQKLSVAGIVESSTGGFKFPDGSIQLKAAAETKWEVNGEDMYSINLGNIGISTSVPAAKLHISSGAGETGNIMIISTGSTNIFRITGEGKVYSNYFYGDGSNLTNVYGTDLTKVSKNGDIISGFLEINQGSVTVIGNTSYPYSFMVTTDTSKNVYNFVVSTTGYVGIGTKYPDSLLKISSLNATGILFSISTGVPGNIFEVSGNGDIYGKKFIGDGSGLTNLAGYVSKSGDLMSGYLTIQGSSLTIINTNTNDKYSLMVTTDINKNVYHFYISTSGNIGIGTNFLSHKLTVNGGGIFSSSITANAGIYTNTINADIINLSQSITASSGTFWAFGNNYSILTTSGIKVQNYGIEAPYFIGDGSKLVNVTGTDSTKLLKAGDIMTGNLEIRGSSLTIASYSDSFLYAMTVSSSATSNLYSMAITTAGTTGFKVNNPKATVHIYRDLMIGSDVGNVVDADLYIKGYNSYLNWGENTSGYEKKGKIGFSSNSRDLIYYSFPSDTSSGIEALRIYSNSQVNFPTLVTVSTSAVPIIYISTISGAVSISTNIAPNKLTVNGGIISFSSITAYTGYYGDSSGILRLNANVNYSMGDFSVGGSTAVQPSARLEVIEKGTERFTLGIGTNTNYGTYDVIITTTGRIGIGLQNTTNEPTNSLQVIDSIRLGADGYGTPNETYINFNPLGNNAYIIFQEQANPSKAVLGTPAGVNYFVFKTNTNNLSGGTEIYRIYKTGQIGIYNTNPQATLHIGSDMLISSATTSPILFISTASGNIGIGTNSPSYKIDINGNAIVRSFMSISGSGLTGSSDVFQVIGGTFTILANGNIGIGSQNPTSRLTVEGSASFGSGVYKSSFTASGFFKPVWLNQTEISSLAPSEIGLIVGNLDIKDLCVSTGTAVGDWALLGSKGNAGCF